ncbi:hypothetical protein [Cupriavidus sp. 8B]
MHPTIENVGGILVPMSRRVFAYDDAGQTISDPLLVSIDFQAIDWHFD